MRFDVIISFNKEFQNAVDIIQKEVQECYPEYSIMIIPDMDFTDV